jgi:hypothetical protein
MFFPARKESSPSRTRGAPKVDSGDVQNFAPPQNRGTRSVPGAFGEEGAKALVDAGDSIQNFAFKKIEQQRDAQALAEERNDKILEVQSARSYSQSVSDGLLAVKQKADANVSLQETQQAMTGVTEETKKKILSEYRGSQTGREKLSLRLENMQSDFHINIGIESRKEQARIIGAQIDQDVDQQALDISANPSRLQQGLDSVRQIMIDNENLLSPEQEDAFRNGANLKLYTAAMKTHLFNGHLADAQDILNDPKARRVLGVESIDEFRSQIKK